VEVVGGGQGCELEDWSGDMAGLKWWEYLRC
jgi:hypothetical protein